FERPSFSTTATYLLELLPVALPVASAVADAPLTPQIDDGAVVVVVAGGLVVVGAGGAGGAGGGGVRGGGAGAGGGAGCWGGAGRGGGRGGGLGGGGGRETRGGEGADDCNRREHEPSPTRILPFEMHLHHPSSRPAEDPTADQVRSSALTEDRMSKKTAKRKL